MFILLIIILQLCNSLTIQNQTLKHWQFSLPANIIFENLINSKTPRRNTLTDNWQLATPPRRAPFSATALENARVGESRRGKAPGNDNKGPLFPFPQPIHYRTPSSCAKMASNNGMTNGAPVARRLTYRAVRAQCGRCKLHGDGSAALIVLVIGIQKFYNRNVPLKSTIRMRLIRLAAGFTGARALSLGAILGRCTEWS